MESATFKNQWTGGFPGGPVVKIKLTLQGMRV